jgi:hypothetical protein
VSNGGKKWGTFVLTLSGAHLLKGSLSARFSAGRFRILHDLFRGLVAGDRHDFEPGGSQLGKARGGCPGLTVDRTMLQASLVAPLAKPITEAGIREGPPIASRWRQGTQENGFLCLICASRLITARRTPNRHQQCCNKAAQDVCGCFSLLPTNVALTGFRDTCVVREDEIVSAVHGVSPGFWGWVDMTQGATPAPTPLSADVQKPSRSHLFRLRNKLTRGPLGHGKHAYHFV